MNELLKGLWKENPTFRLLLGMCPTLAITTAAVNAIGMGGALLFVLVCSNVAVAALRKVIPDKTRLPCFIVLIATFVTIVDLVLKAYFPDIYESLGIFIPLIVVNCIILGRAEAYACKNPVIASALDGVGMGLGATLGFLVLATVREVLGNGTWFGMKVFGEDPTPALVFILPAGAFISLGFLIAGMNAVEERRKANG